MVTTWPILNNYYQQFPPSSLRSCSCFTQNTQIVIIIIIIICFVSFKMQCFDPNINRTCCIHFRNELKRTPSMRPQAPEHDFQCNGLSPASHRIQTSRRKKWFCCFGGWLFHVFFKIFYRFYSLRFSLNFLKKETSAVIDESMWNNQNEQEEQRAVPKE